MNRSRDSQRISDWMEAIQKSRGREAEKTLEYSQRLLEYGESVKEEGLLGYAYYHLAETYYMLNDVGNFFQNIMQALEYLQKSGQWELTAKAENLLGIASNNQGNAPFALDYYLAGKAVCETHDLPAIKAMIEFNIGTVYMSFGEYAQAIFYLEHSFECFLHLPKDEEYEAGINAVFTSLASCYIEKNNLEQAGKYLEEIRKSRRRAESKLQELCILCVEARYYHERQEQGFRDECIQKIEEKMNPHITVLESFEDFYNYCRLLLKIEKWKEFWNMMDILEKIVKESRLIHLQRKLLELKIEYYKKTGDDSSYLQAAGLYYELSQIKEKEEAYIVGHMLDIRFILEESRKKQKAVEAENIVLQHRTETDVLTGIPNRQRLNQLAEEAFLRTQAEQKYLAIEILDVDYFKEFNDNYGHQKGDECLIVIAKELQRFTDRENMFCARYGGDEFVLLYEGYEPAKVRQLAEELKQNILALSIPHVYSKALPIVTISQGICCDIPQKENKVWDFLHHADVMLYQVKKNQRNEISLGLLREQNRDI